MSESNSTRPTTLEAALRALDEAEAKLRARETDDTGILRLSSSMKRSEDRFRLLAQGVPNHLLFLDSDLNIEFANDAFLEAAHTANAWGEVRENRQRLVRAMAAEGFENFVQEWWHFSFAVAGEAPAFDVTVGP